MNAITTTSQRSIQAQAAGGNGGSLVPSTINEAMSLANMMASSKMVPKHIQGDVGTCFMVIEQAQRWAMSPFAVAQCTSNISGKLCYEGKLIAAAVSSTGAIVGEFDYEFSGDPKSPQTLSVKVSATRSSDGQRKEITLEWSKAKTENKYWTLQPEQQLCYAGARVWARRWTPGPLLGVYAPEEMEQRPADNFAGTTIDANPEPASARQQIDDAMQPKRKTVKEWLDAFETDMSEAMSAVDPRASFDTLMGRADVRKAEDTLTNGAKQRFDGIVQTAVAQIAPPAEDDELPTSEAA